MNHSDELNKTTKKGGREKQRSTREDHKKREPGATAGCPATQLRHSETLCTTVHEGEARHGVLLQIDHNTHKRAGTGVGESNRKRREKRKCDTRSRPTWGTHTRTTSATVTELGKMSGEEERRCTRGDEAFEQVRVCNTGRDGARGGEKKRGRTKQRSWRKRKTLTSCSANEEKRAK